MEMNTSPQGWDLSSTRPRFLVPLLSLPIHSFLSIRCLTGQPNTGQPFHPVLCPPEGVSQGLHRPRFEPCSATGPFCNLGQV